MKTFSQFPALIFLHLSKYMQPKMVHTIKIILQSIYKHRLTVEALSTDTFKDTSAAPNEQNRHAHVLYHNTEVRSLVFFIDWFHWFTL